MNTTKAATVARYLRSLSISRDEPGAAVAFASSQNWSDSHRIVSQVRSAAPALGSSPSVIAPVALDFVDLVRPMTIIGRLQGLRRMPFGARMVGLTAATRAHWVATGNSIPISGTAFTSPYEIHRKAVAAILVAADELLRDSDPLVERALVADLVGATVAAIDEAFIDLDNTGSDASPASITSTGFTEAASLSDVDSISHDLTLLVDALLDGGGDLTHAAWVLHPRTATFFAAMRGACGGVVHPGMGITGGTLLGLPALVSAAVPLDTGSPATTQISLIDASGVLLVDEGEAEVSLSQHATLELDTEPTGDASTPTAASKHRVSMFQSGTTAIKAMRYLNWLPRRATVAASLTGVSY